MSAITRTAYGDPDTLHLTICAVPIPSANEVLVRVSGAGVDAGTWHLVTGKPYVMRLFGFGLRTPRDPIPGLAFSGRVVAIGPDVTHIHIGDEVMGSAQGAFAEYVTAKEGKVRPKPRNLSHVHAAALPISGVTAYEAVRDAKINAGDRVLVLGASGGVGHFAVQLAVAAGATVTGVCSSSKAEFVRSLGASDVIDYRETDPTDLEREWDIIIDTAGNRSLRRLRSVLSPDGTLVIVGGENGGAFLGGIERTLAATVVNVFSRHRLRGLVSRGNPADYKTLTALAEKNVIAPRVDSSFPLAEAAAAIDYVRSGKAHGKVVLSL
ncbi:NAD(P)-dependent alcohol dehydrogenase [Subtercola boreus]|uniref:NAD(P)-dependent alcohol dehydrogenase n=2 Tax=Subtercola boreus TaxID=120213 RepID=A0A3E0W461_9MICO|nr:NAD(P)-dependent alcohol dehydrogenase [Subtercola boreus]